MQYQYNGYTIQTAEDNSCIIRNSRGDFMGRVSDDEEAKEFIDDLPLEPPTFTNNSSNKTSSKFLYKRFESYCRKGKLTGMCYPLGDYRFGTVYINVLNRFIASFEKSSNLTVIVDKKYIDGEQFYIVDEVI